jgi:tRNA threonylcarbamoyladenosine biosynthesis protein TsaE
MADEEATAAFARRMGHTLEAGDVLILEGDLGAGKTFFVRALARGLGLDPSVPVTSPTFALIHEYPEARPPLLHADLYRLGDADELFHLGLGDRLGQGWVAAIEWGEAFASELGRVDVILRFHMVGATERTLDLEARTPRGAVIVGSLR